MRVALQLAGRPEGVTPPQLAEKLQTRGGRPWDRANALRLLRALEAAGWLVAGPGELAPRRSPGRRPVVFRLRKRAEEGRQGT
jgi:hypothetical protein